MKGTRKKLQSSLRKNEKKRRAAQKPLSRLVVRHALLREEATATSCVRECLRRSVRKEFRASTRSAARPQRETQRETPRLRARGPVPSSGEELDDSISTTPASSIPPAPVLMNTVAPACAVARHVHSISKAASACARVCKRSDAKVKCSRAVRLRGGPLALLVQKSSVGPYPWAQCAVVRHALRRRSCTSRVIVTSGVMSIRKKCLKSTVAAWSRPALTELPWCMQPSNENLGSS